MFKYRDLQLLNSLYVHSGPQEIHYTWNAYVCGLQKSKPTIMLESAGSYCKINTKLDVCDVSDIGFKGMGKGLSLPDSFLDIVLWLLIHP